MPHTHTHTHTHTTQKEPCIDALKEQFTEKCLFPQGNRFGEM